MIWITRIWIIGIPVNRHTDYRRFITSYSCTPAWFKGGLKAVIRIHSHKPEVTNEVIYQIYEGMNASEVLRIKWFSINSKLKCF